jgi:hypothetical protein
MPNTYISISDFTEIGEQRFNEYIEKHAPFDELPAKLTRRMECLFTMEDALNAGRLPRWKPAGKPTFDPGADGVLIDVVELPDEWQED